MNKEEAREFLEEMNLLDTASKVAADLLNLSKPVKLKDVLEDVSTEVEIVESSFLDLGLIGDKSGGFICCGISYSLLIRFIPKDLLDSFSWRGIY